MTRCDSLIGRVLNTDVKLVLLKQVMSMLQVLEQRSDLLFPTLNLDGWMRLTQLTMLCQSVIKWLESSGQ